jgi:myo-inositol 2-dehydrogenase/D-chiro-inositol 1-dehydrogenase
MEFRSDRRKLLVASAMAVTSSRLGAQGTEEVRTAFLGVGVRGSNLLRQVLLETNVRVTDICDIDPQARDKALSTAAQHKPRSVSEWKRLLDLKDVDAIYIATPCYLHAEMAAACLEAGKYVYCEKPLATMPEGVDQVLRAARRAKGFLQIGQQLRYFPTMREAIQQIHDGLIGRTYVIHAFRHGGRRRPGTGTREQTPQQKVRRAWYADVKRSGDLIVENAIHNIDACNWIANSRPVSGYGHGKKYFPEPIPPGTVMMDGFGVQYIYENDMHCDYSQLGFHPRNLKRLPSGMWYTVFGEKGSVFLTHESAMFYDIYGETERDILTTSKEVMQKQRQRGFGEGDTAVDDFFACIREKRQPFADVRVAATAALTAIMGREAIYKGRSITWKELGVSL